MIILSLFFIIWLVRWVWSIKCFIINKFLTKALQRGHSSADIVLNNIIDGCA